MLFQQAFIPKSAPCRLAINNRITAFSTAGPGFRHPCSQLCTVR